MSSNRAMLEALRQLAELRVLPASGRLHQLGLLKLISVGTERPAAVEHDAVGPGQGSVASAPLPDQIDQDIADLERKIRAFRETKP